MEEQPSLIDGDDYNPCYEWCKLQCKLFKKKLKLKYLLEVIVIMLSVVVLELSKKASETEAYYYGKVIRSEAEEWNNLAILSLR